MTAIESILQMKIVMNRTTCIAVLQGFQLSGLWRTPLLFHECPVLPAFLKLLKCLIFLPDKVLLRKCFSLIIFSRHCGLAPQKPFVSLSQVQKKFEKALFTYKCAMECRVCKGDYSIQIQFQRHEAFKCRSMYKYVKLKPELLNKIFSIRNKGHIGSLRTFAIKLNQES